MNITPTGSPQDSSVMENILETLERVLLELRRVVLAKQIETEDSLSENDIEEI